MLRPLKRDKVGRGYERPRGSEGVIYESTYMLETSPVKNKQGGEREKERKGDKDRDIETDRKREVGRQREKKGKIFREKAIIPFF